MPVTLNSVLQVLLFLVIILLLTKPVGLYLTKVFNGVSAKTAKPAEKAELVK